MQSLVNFIACKKELIANAPFNVSIIVIFLRDKLKIIGIFYNNKNEWLKYFILFCVHLIRSSLPARFFQVQYNYLFMFGRSRQDSSWDIHNFFLSPSVHPFQSSPSHQAQVRIETQPIVIHYTQFFIFVMCRTKGFMLVRLDLPWFNTTGLTALYNLGMVVERYEGRDIDLLWTGLAK